MPIINVEQQPLHFVNQGEGDIALVFVHGSGCDHALWESQIQAFREHYTVAAIDLNGHGASPSREGDALTAYTRDVLAVLDALNRPSVVIGHSLGGALALSVALHGHPNLIGLGLANTGAKLKVLPALLQLLEDDFDGAVDFLLGLLFHRPAPDTVQRTRDQMLKNGQKATSRDFHACNAFDAIARLSQVQLPTWVCVGEHDQMTPVKYAQFLSEKLPQARLDVLPDSGHMAALEQPELFNTGLRAFLADL